MLKNYTSGVPVNETIARIEKILLRFGVTGIMKEYGDNSKVVAVTFQVKYDGDLKVTVRLPANEDQAHEALWKDYVGSDNLTADGERVSWNSRKRKCKREFRDQAERTAWKIVQDWIEVQLSMIEMKQAETIQVFLPYVWNGERTFFQVVKETGFKQLTSGTGT